MAASSGNGKANGVHVEFGDGFVTKTKPIQKFDDIPDIMTMDVPPVNWIVPDMIARGTITLWAGDGGVAKSFLVHSLCIAVATGGLFLGRRCRQSPVLILDYENPAFMVKKRLELMAGAPIDTLKVWGTWLDPPPPRIGEDVLVKIAQESKPLIVFDPFRFAHTDDENDSTDMAPIMRRLRLCAAVGATILIVHHVGKAEGSKGRGSTAIRDHSDVAFVQEMENGLIKLKSNKIRFGPPIFVTVKPDFEEGTFEVTDSPEFVKQDAERLALRKIIEDEPGLCQTEVCRKSKMKKTRAIDMLADGNGTLWQMVPAGQSKHYYPTVPETGNCHGNSGTGSVEVTSSPVPLAFKGNWELVPRTHPKPVPESGNRVNPAKAVSVKNKGTGGEL
jgi:hypothetical protein